MDKKAQLRDQAFFVNFIHIPKNGGNSIRKICEKKGINMIYNGHSTNVYDKDLTNQLVVIRNPIDRFISAVYYAIQVCGRLPHIKNLKKKGINSPEKWVQIWCDPNHCQYHDLMLEMLNTGHYIGNKMEKYKYTYSPQSLWINNPKFVIIMDNFKTEIQYFLEKYKINGIVTKENTTKHIDGQLSEKSIEFLKNFYKEDFIIYEKYKNMGIEKRM
uniref:Uncharacterized protein n=1 Tax=viral metagenome TaxID=1070528 RepID=A0A6C0KY43_9ZZZZ